MSNLTKGLIVVVVLLALVLVFNMGRGKDSSFGGGFENRNAWSSNCTSSSQLVGLASLAITGTSTDISYMEICNDTEGGDLWVNFQTSTKAVYEGILVDNGLCRKFYPSDFIFGNDMWGIASTVTSTIGVTSCY